MKELEQLLQVQIIHGNPYSPNEQVFNDMHIDLFWLCTLGLSWTMEPNIEDRTNKINGAIQYNVS